MQTKTRRDRGFFLIGLLILTAAASVALATLLSTVAVSARDGSASRGMYLAETTARSCLELALPDTIDVIEAFGIDTHQTIVIGTYGSDYFPAVRGRNLSCTVESERENDRVVLVASAKSATDSGDDFEARYSLDLPLRSFGAPTNKEPVSRGQYLAETTVRSCVQLALSNALDIAKSDVISEPYQFVAIYGSNFYPAVQGINLSCTVDVELKNKRIALNALAKASAGSNDTFEARQRLEVSRSSYE